MHRQVPDSDLEYELVSFDKHGKEREAAGALPSNALAARLAQRDAPVTDVFLLSHGWKGDVPAAIEQCDRWIGAMGALQADRDAIRAQVTGYRPLIVGLHWPSLPWGDEKLDGGGRVLGDDDTATGTEAQARAYAEVICDTPTGHALVQRILELSARQPDAAQLDPELAQAYDALRREAGLDSDPDLEGDAGTAGQWNANEAFRDALDDGARTLGDGGFKDALLSPLRQLSFWQMKDRARSVGERGVAGLLRKLQDAAPEQTRFHLMGHSFGCIVVSAAIAGEPNAAPPKPVASAFLAQGALSLWAYCGDVDGTPGYFHRIVKDGHVRGPIVTTRSVHDTAVGKYYPMGARLAGSRTLAELPKYGGVGSFGLQGLGAQAHDLRMIGSGLDYGFAPGRVYNLEASHVIRNGDGASGAHSDIAHPEVAHAAWQAIASGARAA
jgi:hypothetical protein